MCCTAVIPEGLSRVNGKPHAVIREPRRKERQSLLHELMASSCMSRSSFDLVDLLGNSVATESTSCPLDRIGKADIGGALTKTHWRQCFQNRYCANASARMNQLGAI